MTKTVVCDNCLKDTGECLNCHREFSIGVDILCANESYYCGEECFTKHNASEAITIEGEEE